jgi:hypothetical protein
VGLDILWRYDYVKQQNILAIWAKKWVDRRIIPSIRANIASILVKNNMTEYDEMQILLYTGGRCPQDDMWIEEMD